MKNRNKMIRFIFASLLLFVSITVAQGQGKKVKIHKSLKFELKDSSITQSTVETVMGLVEKNINNYVEAAKFEKKGGSVHPVDKFLEQLTSNSRVVQDYWKATPNELSDSRDYANNVWNAYKHHGGLKIALKRVELESISLSVSDFYVVILKVNKQVYNPMFADGTIDQSSLDGESHLQKFEIYIDAQSMTRAKIATIDHYEAVGLPDEYTRIIGGSLGLGTSNYSISTTNYWNKNHADSKLTVSGGMNFSLGGEILMDHFTTSPRATDRKLALTLGARFSSYSYQAELSAFSLKGYDDTVEKDGQSVTYYRKVEAVEAIEKGRFYSVEVPLGISYRIHKTHNRLFYFDLKAIPSFKVMSSGTLKGSAVYDGYFYDESGQNLSEYRMLRNGATNKENLEKESGFDVYHVGEKTIDKDLKTLISPFMMAVQFSPTAYFSFNNDNPGLGISVALDLGYRLNSILQHNPVESIGDEQLKKSDDFEGNLLSDYATNTGGLYFGIRVGVFQKLLNYY